MFFSFPESSGAFICFAVFGCGKNRGTGYFQSEQPALKQWGTGTARQGYGYSTGTGIRHNQQQVVHGTFATQTRADHCANTQAHPITLVHCPLS